jgi:hypothetical protein
MPQISAGKLNNVTMPTEALARGEESSDCIQRAV